MYMKLLKLFLTGKKRQSGYSDMCMSCRQPYRITPIEISFLRQNELPLPTLCRVCLRKSKELEGSLPRVANS